MKKYFFFLIFLIYSHNMNAKNCLIIKDFNTNKIIKQEGEVCEQQFSPCSSFKLAISLMGFDSEILKDEQNPIYKYDGKEEDKSQNLIAIRPEFYNETDPAAWMRNSSLWYSQIVTKKLGLDKFRKYVKQFNYGNQSIEDTDKNRPAISHSWWLVNSSLKISAVEQVAFVERFLNKQLGVSDHAYKVTHDIANPTMLSNGEIMYGKTGSCTQINPDRSENHNRFAGWFVGWTEKNNKPQKVFAKFISDDIDVKPDNYVGPRAKNIMIEELSK